MKTARLSFGVFVLFLAAPATGEEPAKSERWVGVQSSRLPDRTALEKGGATFENSWVIRIDGGPVKQVAAPFQGDNQWKAWKDIPGGDSFDRRSGPYSPDGKKALYFEEDPANRDDPTLKDPDKFFTRKHRIMLVDADGKNAREVLNGLMWWPGFHLCPDGKSVVCGAQEKGKWYAFRVTFDGTVTKLSETAGIAAPVVLPLPEGRILYCPQTSKETVRNGPISTIVTRGSAILIEGKKETVLLKETDRTPSLTPDASKMAVPVRNEKGEEVIEITDRKTGKTEQFPMSSFNKDWKCRFRELKFSPDGKALAVTFIIGGVVIRQKGPLPGDEAVEHFGVIWLDGRKDQTALFRVDQPRETGRYFAQIEGIEWSAGPPAKKEPRK